MIEWKEYGETREKQPPSHVPHLISNGHFLDIGVHELDTKSRVYRWFTSRGQPVAGVTHYAEINLPQAIVPTEQPSPQGDSR